jgi:hypothetical protein
MAQQESLSGFNYVLRFALPTILGPNLIILGSGFFYAGYSGNIAMPEADPYGFAFLASIATGGWMLAKFRNVPKRFVAVGSILLSLALLVALSRWWAVSTAAGQLTGASSTEGARFEASLALQRRRAVGPLVKASRSPNLTARQYAINALTNIQDPRTTDSLIAALDDQDDSVRHGAALGLAAIGYKLDPTDERRITVIHAMTAALTERATARIGSVFSFVINMGQPDAEDALLEALSRFGDADMAAGFLNCGNKRLEDAAGRWASDHGYNVTPSPLPARAGAGATWGKSR